MESKNNLGMDHLAGFESKDIVDSTIIMTDLIERRQKVNRISVPTVMVLYGIP